MRVYPAFSIRNKNLVKTKFSLLFLVGGCVTLLLLSMVSIQTTHTVLESPMNLDTPNITRLSDTGFVTDVPYVWQQINGLCYSATLSMALQSLGIDYDLAAICAATGMGFSTGYVRYEDTLILLPGPMYYQQSTLCTFADLLGLEAEFYMDPDSSEYGPLLSTLLDSQNVPWMEIDGWDDAFQILKDSIDDGFPVGIYVNLQNLPPEDYNLIRELGITDVNPTHSVLVTGYNETTESVQIMDPAIGLFDSPATFPEDGSWLYDVNFTSLNQAWRGYYAITIIKPSIGETDTFSHDLATYIINRLRGDRNSYAPENDELFFWNYGSDAFRALASDLTYTGLIQFMDEFDEYDLQTKSLIFQNLGIEIETSLTLMYNSYKLAIESLPSILSELNLEDFISTCELAFEHFQVFADNDTINTPFYYGGIKLVTETTEDIAYQYEQELDGDLSAALSMYNEDLAEIRSHLIAIANVWDDAATALEIAIAKPGIPLLPSMGGVGAIVVLTAAIIGKRRRDAGTKIT